MVIPFLIAVFFHSICAHSAKADDSRSRSNLFSGAAAEKASRHQRSSGGGETILSQGDLGAGATELDTVKDILNNRRGDFFNQYRAPFYLTYVYGVVPFARADELDDNKIAQRAFIFQTATTLSKVISRSALEPLYRQAIQSVRWFQSYTSVKVQRKGDGGIGVAKRSEKEDPLFELKLHVSANEGIEPRLQIGNNTTLRYDVIDQDTIIEFRHDF